MSRGARLGVPGRDRLFREPDRQAPTLAQGGIILGPVRHPAPLLRDMMPAISIGLERHRGSRVIGGVVHLRQPCPDANRPIRATNSRRLTKCKIEADPAHPAAYTRVCDMCGRPLRSKRNLQERCGTWSGADMCSASAAARSMPRAQMGVRRSGPIQAHALEALVAKLVFLIRSLDRAPSLSCDLPTPRQPRGRDGAYTAVTGAR